ncbi:sulfurtransferase [Marinobacterium arenosum]|uniref:sulfurtransferase n=1 Tax=Marinobacterium arenosum TaxID=2862496 RepID=UPI001C977257|nr:sulfurtransferase [Marinobacterium arenosum]MBY4679032.1 sulfurtransferase [Marinobacterium arenosum]
MHTTLVSAEQLVSHLDDWLILDCRFDLADTEAGRRAYMAGHVPAAHYLHLDEDLSSPIRPDSGRHPLPDPARLAARLAELGLYEGRQVVVYDDLAGAMAGRAWALLRWLGHRAVAVLDGGWSAWCQQGGAVSRETPVAQAGAFQPQLQADYWWSVEQVQQGLAGATLSLVDARNSERFRGEQEPIDPVAGHVPGAINRPLTDNLRDGRFKPADELRAEWQALLADRPAGQPVVHMCGSGVTACHNQLAMEIAGLPGSAVYAGSWSEWIRDPQRPVTTGR